MAAGDIYPVRGYPYRHVVSILDADGDPVTGAAGLDTELVKDYAAATDAAGGEATETGVLGSYYIDLDAADMTAYKIIGVTKSSTTGAKSPIWQIDPMILPVIATGTATAGAASTITLAGTESTLPGRYTGKFIGTTGGTGSGQIRKIISYSAGRVATIFPAWNTAPDATTTYELLEPGSLNPHMEAEPGIGLADIWPDYPDRTVDLTPITGLIGTPAEDTLAEDIAIVAANALSAANRVLYLMAGLGITRLERTGDVLTGYAEDLVTVIATWDIDTSGTPLLRVRTS